MKGLSTCDKHIESKKSMILVMDFPRDGKVLNKEKLIKVVLKYAECKK